MTDDIKKKLSRINSKRWIVTNPNGQEIIVDDMMRFCRENNLRRNAMTSVSSGKVSHHKGWKVRHEGENSPRYVSRIRSGMWQVIDPDGRESQIKNLSLFCKEKGLSHVGMDHTARGYQSHHRGWKCKKIVDGKVDTSTRFVRKSRQSYRIICPDGKIVVTDFLPVFCREKSLNVRCMRLVSYGETSQHRGYKCMKIAPSSQ